MIRLLNIQGSPRREKSASIAVADAFLDAFRAAHPGGVEVDTLNVFDEALPEFDHAAIEGKYKAVGGEALSDAESSTWAKIEALAARFQRADRIVMGVPMWNFAYPYKLKQLIDLACQRGLLFTFDGTTFGPKLSTPRALVIYTRGQAYAPGTPLPPSTFDHQTPFIEFWLRFVGVREVQSITVENAWGNPEDVAEPVNAGKAEARRLATTF